MREQSRSETTILTLLHAVSSALDGLHWRTVRANGVTAISVSGNGRSAEFGFLDLNQPFVKTDSGFGRTFIDEDSNDDELEDVLGELAAIAVSYINHGATLARKRWSRTPIARIRLRGESYDLWPMGRSPGTR